MQKQVHSSNKLNTCGFPAFNYMKSKKSKIGRPKASKHRVKANFSVSDDVVMEFNDFINSKSINGSKLLEKLILEHMNKNNS